MRKKLLFTAIPVGLVAGELALAFLLSFLISNSVYVTLLVDFVFAVGLGIWYYKFMRQTNLQRQFGTARLVGLILIQCPIWLLGQIVATYLIQVNADLYASQSEAFSDMSVFWYLMLSICLAPITEELIFRGFWYTYLKKAWGIIPAAFISALGFSVLHGNLPQGYITLLMGLFYALCMEYTGRVWVVIALHMAANILDGMSSLLLVPTFFIEPWFFVPVNLVCLTILIVLIIRSRKHVVSQPVQDASLNDKPVLADVHEGMYEKTEQDEAEQSIELK